MDISVQKQQLEVCLEKFPGLALAVSGGVDSLTLAAFAHNKVPGITLYHAVSPAVPVAATQRLESLAAERSWQLKLLNAGELDDANYRRNPVNRCYFCKQNLYEEIRRHADGPVASGTNVDDLADFRPGLEAAKEAGVIHPFVEAGFTKAMIRVLAAELGLGGVAVLPASPCLSSRVRTGVAIDGELLGLVDRAETVLRRIFPEQVDVRCRIHGDHLLIQLAPFDVDEGSRAEAEALIRQCFSSSSHAALADRIEWGAYLQGSAFVHSVIPT